MDNPRHRSCTATSPTPRSAGRSSSSRTSSCTSPPRRTSTARSWPPASSSAPTSTARSCCSRRRGARRDLRRFVQISTDEVYGSVPTGASRETDELRAAQSVCGEQGRRRSARLQLLGDLRRAGHHHARVEQLRAVSVSREGDPAVRHQRDRRHPGAALRRRPERARLAARRRPLPRARSAHRARRRTARSTTSAAATRS